MVEIGEHCRPIEGTVPPGVYRVVGTGDPVVLLRVGTADGARVNTGEIYEVDRASFAEEFESARDPGAGLDPTRAVRNALSGLYWQVRRFF